MISFPGNIIILTASRLGNNVIADHALVEPAWVQQCAILFADLPAWFVGVNCALEILEQREQQCEDRTLGQARAQFDVVDIIRNSGYGDSWRSECLGRG